MKSLRSLKARYLDLHAREKLLLAGFVLLAALIWLSSFAGRARVFGGQIAQNLSILRQQEQVLLSRDEVERRAANAAVDLVPGRTYDGTQLLSQVDAMRRTAGLTNSNVIPANTGQALSTDQLALNSVSATFNEVRWSALKQFYEAVEGQSPYISIDQMQVTLPTSQQTATTPLHTVRMVLSSVQVKQ